jgi:hypothetical protein
LSTNERNLTWSEEIQDIYKLENQNSFAQRAGSTWQDLEQPYSKTFDWILRKDLGDKYLRLQLFTDNEYGEYQPISDLQAEGTMLFEENISKIGPFIRQMIEQ